MAAIVRAFYFALNFVYIVSGIAAIILAYFTFLNTNPFNYDATLVDRPPLVGLAIVGALTLMSGIFACFSSYRPRRRPVLIHLFSIVIVAVAAFAIGFVFVADADPVVVYDGSLWAYASNETRTTWQIRHNCCGFSITGNATSTTVPTTTESPQLRLMARQGGLADPPVSSPTATSGVFPTATPDPSLANLTLLGATDPACPAVQQIISNYLNFSYAHANVTTRTEAYVNPNCRDPLATDRAAVHTGYGIFLFCACALDILCFAVGILTLVQIQNAANDPSTNPFATLRRPKPKGQKHDVFKLFGSDGEPAWLVALREEHTAAETALKSSRPPPLPPKDYASREPSTEGAVEIPMAAFSARTYSEDIPDETDYRREHWSGALGRPKKVSNNYY
ncbi:hypothetical protein BJ742DRAFT_461368 [Cladochytrium replicatum]|nr:hypothetical protein BJ742DRAFT_461368 [Cladochytrium replicatum]